ncbi:MAG: hypothetical protein ACRD3T_21140 [Terriglobia bacterium]
MEWVLKQGPQPVRIAPGETKELAEVSSVEQVAQSFAFQKLCGLSQQNISYNRF